MLFRLVEDDVRRTLLVSGASEASVDGSAKHSTAPASHFELRDAQSVGAARSFALHKSCGPDVCRVHSSAKRSTGDIALPGEVDVKRVRIVVATRAAMGIAILGGLVVIAAPACDKYDSFECGVDRAGHTVVCDRPLETCICATRKCAVRGEKTADCESGLRYSDRWPFHPKDRAGVCVPKHELALDVRDPTSAELCPGVLKSPSADAAAPPEDAGEPDGAADALGSDAQVDVSDASEIVVVDARVDGAEGGDQ